MDDCHVHIQKAVINSRWMEPDKTHESALTGFIKRLLSPAIAPSGLEALAWVVRDIIPAAEQCRLQMWIPHRRRRGVGLDSAATQRTARNRMKS